jgi:uncharacterized membrane protein YdfJ with MMPL/SSD domain
MNTEYTSPTQGKSFWPITLVSVSIIIFFISQLKGISQDRENLRTNSTKMEEAVSLNLPKLEEQVGKAKQVQDAVTKLANDLLELSKTDDSAKQIITKYGIKHQTPPGGTDAPATSTP